jgi:hypothetical protein
MITFTMPKGSTPEQVRDAIKGEAQRRADNAKSQHYRFKTKIGQAGNHAEVNTYLAMVKFLDQLEFVE